jgi:hypothetical protein
MSDGTLPRRGRMGRGKARDRRTGVQRARGRLPSPAHVGVRWKERGAVTGCACEAGVRRTGTGCAAVHPDTRSSGRRSPTVLTGTGPWVGA